MYNVEVDNKNNKTNFDGLFPIVCQYHPFAVTCFAVLVYFEVVPYTLMYLSSFMFQFFKYAKSGEL